MTVGLTGLSDSRIFLGIMLLHVLSKPYLFLQDIRLVDPPDLVRFGILSYLEKY